MLHPRRRRAVHRAVAVRRATPSPLRLAAGAAAAGAVVLTVTGASLVGPAKTEATQAAARETTAQRVAQVWRSAGSAQALPQQAAAPSPEVVALQAELVSERGGTASRSQDRLSAAEPTAAGPAEAPSAPASAQDAPTAGDEAVARAQERVAELQVQEDADGVDAQAHRRASGVSAAQARAAVETAQAQRAAEAAAAELAAAQADPRAVAAPLVAGRGWGADQFACLDKLWTKESGWKWWADNPTSSAYGIPQSLPGEKMASHGEGWREDPRVQVAWGVDYIAAAYGTPCRAWAHSQATDWY